MAFFYMRTSIIRASSGKSAVASAAYISAQALYNERLGQRYQYRNKEEVVFSEVLLPEYAPPEFKDREKLWNAVEAKENKCNSRYARQFIVALPNEWSDEESIERTRAFIQTALVDKGMCADWALHRKTTKEYENLHIHIQCTVRGFNKDGSWAQMEKKEYALDKDGNRVPEIDPQTGEQKIRMKTKKGKQYPEKIWKRVTVQTNDWNSKAFLKEVKRQWAETCNKYLPMEEQMDFRSYREQGINRVPLIHEALGSRAAYERGVVFDDVRENSERRKINQQLASLEKFIKEARRILEELKNKLKQWRDINGKTRSIRTNRSTSRNGATDSGVSRSATGSDGRDDEFIERWAQLENRSKKIRRRH